MSNKYIDVKPYVKNENDLELGDYVKKVNNMVALNQIYQIVEIEVDYDVNIYAVIDIYTGKTCYVSSTLKELKEHGYIKFYGEITISQIS